jgi:hypothetical protein
MVEKLLNEIETSKAENEFDAAEVIPQGSKHQVLRELFNRINGIQNDSTKSKNENDLRLSIRKLPLNQKARTEKEVMSIFEELLEGNEKLNYLFSPVNQVDSRYSIQMKNKIKTQAVKLLNTILLKEF